jgi:hypothetical protein
MTQGPGPFKTEDANTGWFVQSRMVFCIDPQAFQFCGMGIDLIHPGIN